MKFSPFSRAFPSEPRVEVPTGYRKTVSWQPRIGDIFPNFWAETTDGPLSFHLWAENSWTFLFSHPKAFTPVCTTELADFATAQLDFSARNCKIVGVSRDSCETQKSWLADINKMFDTPINFPMIQDPNGKLSETFGMVHPNEHPDLAIRKSFIIDPSLRVRMIFEYPLWIGRSTHETLRVLDALQISDRYTVGTPADWELGDPCVLPSGKTDDELDRRYGPNRTRLRNYLQMMPTGDLRLPA